MKLNAQFKGTLVAIEENKTSDGKNSYYKLAVLQGAECTTLSCTKDVFDSKPELFKEHGFGLQIGEYDNKPTFRVHAVFDVSTSSTSSATAPSSGATGARK